ncbi:MAG: Ig-like domain-containing protein [archaeon]
MIKRGQASTEMLILIGMAVIVIGLLVVYSQTTLFSAKDQYKEEQARLAVEDITSTAEYIYQQGLGAKTRVYVTIPNNVAYTNVTSNYVSITFDNGNSVVSSVDFDVTGSLPENDGSYWIEIESQGNYVYISTNVSEIVVETCGDGTCSAGENCPADVISCVDNVCYEPTCVSGCGQTAIVSAVDVGECDSTTVAGSCVDVPCICSGVSVCVDVVANDTTAPVVSLIAPANGSTNTIGTIDFLYNITDASMVSNCSLYVSSVLKGTDLSVSTGVTKNITSTLSNGAYTWYISCVDASNNVGISSTRSLTVGEVLYLDLWSFNEIYPVSFDTGVNSTANTFWLVGGSDGWDWINGTYMGGPSNLDTCINFGNNSQIEVYVGDENCGSGDDLGQGSGAYGIEFYVDSSTYSLIDVGIANLSFSWEYSPMAGQLDASEDVWVKATIGNETIFGYEDFESSYLGSSYSWVGGFGWLYDWYRSGAGTDTIGTTEYSGRYAMQLSGENNWVDRAIDLHFATNPKITFYAMCTGLESNDHAYFYVSPDDSVYTELQSWTNGDDDGVWREYTFDLTSYFASSNEFWIAFETPDFNNANDKCYFDQIIIYEGDINYLGDDLDSGVDQSDVSNEIYWENNPGTGANGFVSYDISSYIQGEGWYYLTLGGQVYRWNAANEGANFYFDDVMIYVE